MYFLYSLLVVVVAVDVFCVFAWMSKKCLVLDDGSPYPLFSIGPPDCPGNQLRASCDNVSDIAGDLSVPKDIKALCVWVDHRSTIQPEALTKFHSLRSLYIHGCLSAVFSEAFKGLTNLQLLSMSCPDLCNASIPSKVFHDLYNLKELKLENYALSSMASDVFYGLRLVKSVDFRGAESFPDLLCRLSYFSVSIEYLSVEMAVETVAAANCTHGASHFPSLKNVNCSFPYLKKIERNAFKHMKSISVLRMPMNNVLHTQLLQSGLKQIEEIYFSFTEINIKSVCEVIFAMSIPIAHLYFKTFQNYSVLSWEKCYKLKKVTLDGQDLTGIDFSFMSALQYVFSVVISVRISNDRILKEDKSLASLCQTNVSVSTLRYLSYSTRQSLVLRTGQFDCLSHLEGLFLEGNDIHIEEFAFQGLYHLEDFWLTATRYRMGSSLFEESAYKGQAGLRFLWVYACVVVVTRELFSDLVNLEQLFLCSCSIQTIKDFAFTNLTQLRHLDLTGNKISKITTNTFFGLKNLETLILERNPLRNFEASSFAHFPALRILHLGNLKFCSTEHSGMQVLNLSLIFGSFPRLLSSLTITSVLRPMTLVIADNSTPEVGLSLSLSGQRIVIWGCERPFFKSVTKLDVVTDVFLCAPDNSPAFSYFMSVVDLYFVQVKHDVVQGLSGLNRLVKLKRLDLANINFINLSGISLIFRNMTNLESLSLSDCWLDSLEGELSLDLTSLKYFFFDNVQAGVSLTTAFFEHLSGLKIAILHKVNLRCTCDNVRFFQWAANQQQAEVVSFNEPLQCTSLGSLQDLDGYGQIHCSLDVGFLLFVNTMCFVVMFMTVVLLHQLAREYLQAFYHIGHGWLNEVLRHHQDTRGRYLYDAFVSYSSRDERWVVDELLPNLEQRGPPFLQLCLHSRDFQLGKDVVENITDSVYRSRHTLCLISRHYLRSTWCSLEMRLGTYRLQVEHRDVLILVFLEKIPSNLLSAHHRLARLVKTKTYIEWPQDPAQQEAFWERLRKKLLPDRVK